MYLWHVKLVAKAWSLKGDAESAERKFQTICLWLTAGRSSEAAWLSWDTMDWDAEFDCIFAELPQSKVSEVKLVAFMAGNTAESCFYACLGDYLVMCGGRRHIYEEGEPEWVFPELQAAKSPGSVLGAYMKALLVRGGARAYAAVAQSELPETINASFFRSGAANFMALFMPAEFVAHLTGHLLNGRSALYEYLEVCRALLMPGAVVLAGWPALPWGQLGKGAKPASFVALEQIGVGMDVIVPFVARLFSLDSSSPTQLRPASASSPAGGLWKATLAAAATLVMYYEERCAARPRAVGAPYRADARLLERGPWCRRRRPPRRRRLEQQQQQQWRRRRLHRVRERARGAAPLECLIAAEFRVANLHLTARTGPGGEGAASVVAAVGGIVDSVDESRRATCRTTLDLHRSLDAKLSALTLELRRGGGRCC